MTAGNEAAAVPRPLSQALLQEHDGWLYFASVSGERGRLWAAEFRQTEPMEIVATAGRALPLFHRREFEKGRRLLEEAETGLRSLGSARPSIVHAVESIYFPLLAYYHYCLGEFAPAGQDLDGADRAVAAAIGLEPFLLPLAFRCSEFELHRARIARNQRRWEEMHLHIGRTLEMIHGDRPFCVLPGGGQVLLSEVQAFFRGLPPGKPEMEVFARQLTDDKTRYRLFDLFILGIYAVPGFVIPQS
jgi:hypothetical protein